MPSAARPGPRPVRLLSPSCALPWALLPSGPLLGGAPPPPHPRPSPAPGLGSPHLHPESRSLLRQGNAEGLLQPTPSAPARPYSPRGACAPLRPLAPSMRRGVTPGSRAAGLRAERNSWDEPTPPTVWVWCARARQEPARRCRAGVGARRGRPGGIAPLSLEGLAPARTPGGY